MKGKFLLHMLTVSLYILSACQATNPSTPTATALPPTATARPSKTPKPTKTSTPTTTPDVAATKRYDEFYTLLEQLNNDGYISSAEGTTTELGPFNEEMAQIGWLRYWVIKNLNQTNSDFVFKAKFNWISALSDPEASGCGFVFGIQENGDYYALYLTNDNIRFYMHRGSNLYSVGKTSGSGVYNFDNPAEAEFVIAVSDQKAYVLVDDVPTLYTLSVDQTTNGYVGYSLLSGTNRDYGTRCEITEPLLWTNEGNGTITLSDGVATKLPIQASEIPEEETSSLNLDSYNPNKHSDYPSLEDMASEKQESDGVRQFEVTVSPDEGAIISIGWCTTTEEILNENLEQMTMTILVDNIEISLDDLYPYKSVESEMACQSYFGVFDEWSPGEHVIERYHIYDVVVNDGWDDYPPGKYGSLFKVLVEP